MKIKLCGLFRECDIDYVNDALPDYIGFVFAKSKRQVTLEQAILLKKNLSSQIQAVGVFVNESIEYINRVVNSGVIHIVQLHGDEDEEYIAKINAPVIKAVRIGDKIVNNAQFILFDGINAGSGTVFDWSLLPKLNQPFFLAGGIDLNNVNDAMKQKPYCIDISSGIETNGYKDKDKILKIVRRIRDV